MSLQSVLNNIQLSSGNTDAFNSQTTALLTNLYNDGGAEAVELLETPASHPAETI